MAKKEDPSERQRKDASLAERWRASGETIRREQRREEAVKQKEDGLSQGAKENAKERAGMTLR